VSGSTVSTSSTIRHVTREPAFQDYYPEHLAHCYGCGRLNAQGYRLETRWDAEESVTLFTPAPYYTAVPGVVYGGLLASIVDCHSTGTAAAALYRVQGRAMDTEPAHRCVTGTLRVRFLHPTPLGPTLEVRGRVTSIERRKVTVVSRVLVGDVVTIEAEVVAIEMPDGFGIPVLRSS
jgi:acyl-coenzyme A thioesterase PaaI-like protein